MYNYLYFIGSLFFLFVWGLFFYLRKDLRKEMFIMSLLILPLGPISEYWYFKDYWQPELLYPWIINIEDLIFAWSIGGIGAVAYEIFFNKTLSKRRNQTKNSVLMWFFVLTICAFIVGKLLGINSIFASSFAFILCALLILISRKNLWKDILFSGILTALIMFLIYAFFLPQIPTNYWHNWLIYGTKYDFLLFGTVPLTELIWGFSWGMAVGALYEFWQGYRLKNRK